METTKDNSENQIPKAEDSASETEGTPKAEDSTSEIEGTPKAEDSASETESTPKAEDSASETEGTPKAEDSASETEGTPKAEDSASETESTPKAEDSVSETEGTPKAEDSASETESTPKAEDSASETEGTPKAEDSASETESTPKAEDSASETEGTPKAEDSASETESTPKAEDSASETESTPKAEDSASETESTPKAEDSASETESTPKAKNSDLKIKGSSNYTKNKRVLKSEKSKSFYIKKSTEKTKKEATSLDLGKKEDKYKFSGLNTKKKPRTSLTSHMFSGRRKTSVARLYTIKGSGKVIINKKDMKDYFPMLDIQREVMSGLRLLKLENKMDIYVNVKGGGFRGQAGAISLAIAKTLSLRDESGKQKLRSSGLLTRDSRMVERKKYGLHKARRAPQFSKR